MRFEKRNITVIGSLNMDLSTKVARLPQQGETLHGASFAFTPGGKGANQAVAAARLGARSVFAGRVGDDPFSAELTKALVQRGVDTEHVVSLPKTRTGTAVIFVDEAGNSTIVVSPGANFRFYPQDVHALTPIIAGADALLLQLEIPLDTLRAILRIARKHDTRTFLDCGPAQALDREILSLADLISPNETEAEALTGQGLEGIKHAPEVAAKLHAMGASEVVLKLGEHGAFYAGRGDTCHVPAFHVDVVDATAAGDAFMAALALAWDKVSVAEALRQANGAGALATTRHGAQDAVPYAKELEEFLEKATSIQPKD